MGGPKEQPAERRQMEALRDREVRRREWMLRMVFEEGRIGCEAGTSVGLWIGGKGRGGPGGLIR